MMSAIMALIGMIPGISSLVQFLVGKFYDSKVAITTAKIGGNVAIATQMIQADVTNNQTKVSWLMAISSSPVLMFIILGFAFPFIFYINKVVVWDICLGLGSTPSIKSVVIVDWANVIIGGIFVSSTSVGIGQMVLRAVNKP